MKKLSAEEFQHVRREKLLSYEIYEYNFEEMLSGFNVVRSVLSKTDALNGKVGKYEAAVPQRRRAWDGLTFLLNCYSGGHPVAEIAQFFPAVLEFWESYSQAWELFQNSDESTNGTVATLPLLGTQFSYANQLICLGALLGWGGTSKECRRL
jgi:hypothetical protein